jgi:hypothetical protein
MASSAVTVDCANTALPAIIIAAASEIVYRFMVYPSKGLDCHLVRLTSTNNTSRPPEIGREV